MTASPGRLERLFRPAHVAVVGATERAGSYGAQVLENLAAIGYPGEVWGVNPGRTEVMGHPCVPTVAELPVAVDAVVVAIPAAGVPDVIEAAGARGCGSAVVFGAGFREAAGGADLERRLVESALRYELPVCGPNCDGIVSMPGRVALWGDAFEPREAGHVALVAQSGNVAVNALASHRGLRLHTAIASGNQAILSAADYLTFLAEEEGLASIALYLEDDGGPELCESLARCAEAGIRVAVLKVGSSAVGARSAGFHTAALAGDQRVFRSLMGEAGAVWAEDVHELLELAKTLAVRPRLPPHPGVAIMTCSGGDSAQGADQCDRLGLILPELQPGTRAGLAEQLPDAATVANPLDYTAIIWGEDEAIGRLICTLGADPSVDQVVVFYDQPPRLTGAVLQSWSAVRHGIIRGAAAAPVPVMVCSTLPELLDDTAAWQFAQAGIPAAAGLRTGLRCVAAMAEPAGDPDRLRAIGRVALRVARAGPQVAGRPVRAGATPASGPGGAWVAEHEAKELLAHAGVGTVEGRVISSERELRDALAELGGRIALKVSAAGLRHKSELKALALDLTDEESAVREFRRLQAIARERDGVILAERMAGPGVELLVAVQVDAVVPAVVIGLGGIFTEIFDDVAVVPLPASAERVEQAIRALRGAALLSGARGLPPVDVAAAAELTARASRLVGQGPLEMFELNPVIVGPWGAVAVDAVARRSAPVAADQPAQAAILMSAGTLRGGAGHA
ncbi:MAG TPA: acetate--CoA ligase family protein [Solirubrobacteraceae bacterium]|nr:acetate--CoA ligase family protein [Solirubrobacteraceae bacterium]